MGDWYIDNIITSGDEISESLAEATAKTVGNQPNFVRILQKGKNGLAVVKPPKGKLIVVNSTGGIAKFHKTSLDLYVQSMITHLTNHAKNIHAIPIGFSNVVDARSDDQNISEKIKDNLIYGANQKGLTVLNGEFANLGSQVTTPANIMGTMISFADPRTLPITKGTFKKNGVKYAVFNPGKDYVYINSDGIGTKTEFYERIMQYHLGIDDFAAMNLDDTIKLGAKARVISGVLEAKGKIPIKKIMKFLEQRSFEWGVQGILQYENVGKNILGFHPDSPSYNISGSTVSTLSLENLNNLPHPSAGEYLVVVSKRKPTPRSNGITDKRKAMIKQFGEKYHETKEGKKYLEFLAEPSTVFYPIIRETMKHNLATSFYHMSGGAFEGKLAKPLAKEGLFAELIDLFPADERELDIMEWTNTTMRDAYAKWPMGNEAFISTKNPAEAVTFFIENGYKSKIAGKLESAKNCGKLGVSINCPMTYETINFSGLK